MTRQMRIQQKLTSTFNPTQLEVVDVSDQHIGHAGWHKDGETHFEINIACKKFQNLSRLDAHRLVNDALTDEFSNGLHALQIRILI